MDKGEQPLRKEAERLSAWAAASAWGGDHAFEEVLRLVEEDRVAASNGGDSVHHDDPFKG